MEIISQNFYELLKSQTNSDETVLDLIKPGTKVTKNYSLNQRKAMEKIAENAKLLPFEIKSQNSCTTIQFNSGAYKLIMMNVAKCIKEGDKIQFDEYEATCMKAEQTYDSLKESS